MVELGVVAGRADAEASELDVAVVELGGEGDALECEFDDSLADSGYAREYGGGGCEERSV